MSGLPHHFSFDNSSSGVLEATASYGNDPRVEEWVDARYFDNAPQSATSELPQLQSMGGTFVSQQAVSQQVIYGCSSEINQQYQPPFQQSQPQWQQQYQAPEQHISYAQFNEAPPLNAQGYPYRAQEPCTGTLVQASSTPTPTPAPTLGSEALTARPQRKTPAKQAAPMPGWTGKNPTCQDCGKSFKPTVFNNGTHCNKHAKKVQKEERSKQAPIYEVDESLEAKDEQYARNMLYPFIPPLAYEGEGDDDWREMQGQEDIWLRKLLAAANQAYSRTEPEEGDDDDDRLNKQRIHDNAVSQQKTYNHKPHEESSKGWYTMEWVNTRIRLLFRSVLIYHKGGKLIYPVGGSNNGYGENKVLKMSERLEEIEHSFRDDKRVVMDVIEGRGVAALAANPTRFAERKDSNNKCNQKKKRKVEEREAAERGGTEGLVEEGDDDAFFGTPATEREDSAPRRPARKKPKRAPARTSARNTQAPAATHQELQDQAMQQVRQDRLAERQGDQSFMMPAGASQVQTIGFGSGHANVVESIEPPAQGYQPFPMPVEASQVPNMGYCQQHGAIIPLIEDPQQPWDDQHTILDSGGFDIHPPDEDFNDPSYQGVGNAPEQSLTDEQLAERLSFLNELFGE